MRETITYDGATIVVMSDRRYLSLLRASETRWTLLGSADDVEILRSRPMTANGIIIDRTTVKPQHSETTA
jgi:hypothetical protein